MAVRPFASSLGPTAPEKTFFLNLIRSIALEKKLVTVHADLTPERRLQASGGQARSLYSELMRNLATRAKPDGGAIGSVVERFVSEVLQEAREKGLAAEPLIHERLQHLMEMTGGYDFAQVIAAYWRAFDAGNEQLKSDAVRWLRAEFTTRTDARNALGVRTIIDDDNFYDHLKLMSRFVRLAGFGGLFVMLDEMVNLFKLAHTQARNANYEQILRILNDCLQGTASGLGVLFGGTPEFLLDHRRGLYSYQALQSRLAENAFAVDGRVDYGGPVLRLASLSPEEFYLLLQRIRHVFAAGHADRHLVPDEALHQFMRHCEGRLGDSYFRTPRTTIREFVNLLAVLEQNPSTQWSHLIGDLALTDDVEPSGEPAADDDELTSVRL